MRDDRRLVRRMLAGDERAFSAFFDGHFDRLYRFALVRVGGNADVAEEVAQATLCKAMTKLHTFRGEAALFTWLCTFCRHEISAHYRKSKRAGDGVALIEDDPEVRAALESIPGALDGGPVEQLDRKELARLVQVALDALPAHYGNALEWKYLEEVRVDRIAERLDLSPKAAESLLTRARAAFRDAFVSLLHGHGTSEVRR